MKVRFGKRCSLPSTSNCRTWWSLLMPMGYQAMGRTSEVMDMTPFAAKLAAFGFETREVDGHDQVAIARTFAELTALAGDQPRAVVAHTVKGHGISFMEDDNRWHYTRLTPETYQKALAELC